MTRLELRRRALFLLDEPDVDNPVFFSTAELNDMIDEALEVVSEEVREVKKVGYLALKDGRMFYDIALIDPLCMAPTRVWLSDYEKPLNYTTVMELSRERSDWMAHTAERPHHWFAVDHRTFGIYPRPTTVTEVLRVDYHAWASPVADDYAILPYDDATLDAAVYYVVYSGLMKRWDIARAGDTFRDFASFFQDAVFRKESRRFQYALNQRLGTGAEDYIRLDR